jgi:ribosomal protein RSM22 (predicted rRNA methylase)
MTPVTDSAQEAMAIIRASIHDDEEALQNLLGSKSTYDDWARTVASLVALSIHMGIIICGSEIGFDQQLATMQANALAYEARGK